ncbi:MAG TPA: hypothetical protein VFA78_01795 [Chloroflexota bacterium]|nr:hypothetical protein [Chloroflexota bacterium]
MANTNTTTTRGTNLTDSPLMQHLLDSLKAGKDIGHYGRLTFVMVAQWFMDDNDIVSLLEKERDVSNDDARALVAEVKAHKYVPPKPQTIQQWQQMQDFSICPQSDDPNACNVYDHLQFPDKVYDEIGEYWEDRVESASS